MLNKNNIPELTNDIVTSFLKSLDEFDLFDHDGLLVDIPFGKIAGYLAKKIIEINTADEALQKAVAMSYLTSFIQGVKFLNFEDRLTQARLGDIGGKVNESFEQVNFDAKEFDIHNFNGNIVAEHYMDLFREVMKAYDMEEMHIQQIAKYVKDYAPLNFHLLLEKSATVFNKLISFLDSKSYQLIREDYLLKLYQVNLVHEFQEPVWNDKKGLTLDQLYVKPNFKVHQYSFKEEEERIQYKDYKENNGFVDMDYPYESIHELIYETLTEKNRLKLANNAPQLILLLGYPGQGKTSFCKKMLYDTYADPMLLGKDLFFLKFRNISRVRELLNNPLATLKEKIRKEIGFEVSDQKIEESILLLDGLDELYMKENMEKDEIDTFIRNFLRELKNEYKQLKIVITSRYGYLYMPKLKDKNILIAQLSELSIEQQQRWLANYKKYHPNIVLTQEKIKEIHENKSGNLKHIAELIKQPILLHMIARLPEEISADDNKAKIYDNLFSALVKREYDTEEEGQIDVLKGPSEKDLRKVIREIAFAIFKSGNEYIHKTQMEKLPAVEQFMEKLENRNMNNALKSLMIAFYFQEVKKKEGDEGEDKEKREEYAVEFLHKSLKEYLVAEKIWLKMKNFINKNSEEDYTIDSFEEAMGLTFPLLAKQVLSKEIIDYLSEIIKNDEMTDKNKEELHTRLVKFFPAYIKNNFLQEYKAEKNTAISAFDLANNHCYGYWSILSHLHIDRNAIPEEEAIQVMLIEQFYSLLYKNRYINLGKQQLKNTNLRGINLSNAILDGAILDGASLDGAILDGAILDRAILDGAILDRAILVGAILVGASLVGASLDGAILDGAILDRARLDRARLVDTDLKDVEGLTVEQLIKTASLKGCRNLDPKLEQGVRDAGYGHLFEE